MKITISGVPPYDGTYELADEELTTREWGWIKRLAGYLPLELSDQGAEAAFSDPELACTMSVIALRRAGKVEAAAVPRVFEQLADAPFGSAITIEPDDEEVEGDAGPPVSRSSGNSVSSGAGSRTSSETSTPPPKVSGIRESASLASVRSTSAT